MAARASLAAESFEGLPCWRLRLAGGDSLLVAEHGAHVLSWIAGGRERLFLSPRSAFDGQGPIRGGVPVCWPQFNERGNAPKHGFARNLPWLSTAVDLGTDSAQFELTLCSSERTRALWPHEFELALTLDLQPGRLRLTLAARNTGARPLAFGGALHSYFACDDIAQAELGGLQGRPEWDSLTDVHASGAATLRFDAEFDRVYSGAAVPMLLRDGAHALRISQSESWGDTVVWNPHAAKCARLADMEPQGWRRMLCVEAARVFEPVTLAPGASWRGWQQLETA
ncbi:MAG: putative glucose-6-phosphate 1-epimerase [Pseudomonadota bacterium]|jgi:glucose-6-phosphate 1-epimerase